MSLFYKLYQPLRSHKFHRSAYVLSKQIYNDTLRRINLVDALITENADIYEKLKSNNLSTVNWKDIREEVLKKNQEITPTTVDSTIINMCLKVSHVDNAIAYFKFLRENNYSLNAAVIGKYLKLYVFKQNSLTDADKLEIVETYNALRQQYPYLDSFTAENCIMSLCLTDEWEKMQDVIEMMKITSAPGTTIYSALASAAFRNRKPDIAWKALSDIILRKLSPQNIAYISHLQYCQMENAKVFNSRMEEMFYFWIKHNIVASDEVIRIYADAASKYGWSTDLITIPTNTGNCTHCGRSLAKITVSKEDFQELAKSVMNRVIIGSDIYCKTNPKELLKFKTFIDNTKPYDIVIDGLNITYTQLRKQKSDTPKLIALINVIDHFTNYGKKVLVLTRKHQRKLSTFKYVEQKAPVFLIDDLSDDDPYILYATMASGINTKFISLDLMRQHKHSLQDERLRQIFTKWQYSHQYFMKSSATGFRIQEPFVFMSIAQKNENSWHIPYINEDRIHAEYQFPNRWYCFKYNQRENKY